MRQVGIQWRAVPVTTEAGKGSVGKRFLTEARATTRLSKQPGHPGTKASMTSPSRGTLQILTTGSWKNLIRPGTRGAYWKRAPSLLSSRSIEVSMHPTSLRQFRNSIAGVTFKGFSWELGRELSPGSMASGHSSSQGAWLGMWAEPGERQSEVFLKSFARQLNSIS